MMGLDEARRVLRDGTNSYSEYVAVGAVVYEAHMSQAPPERCLTTDAARRPYLRDRPIPMPNSNVTAGGTACSARRVAKLPGPAAAYHRCSASHPPGLRRGERPADVASAMRARVATHRQRLFPTCVLVCFAGTILQECR